MLQHEILPDIILMPNIGTRGILWQEIEGHDRQTPASMLLPAICLSDIHLMMLRLTGEFRWEMCKRVQGARWNDVTDHSLTSEFFDYLQFYKKNRDLSADAKEKCHMQLQKAKNRFKDAFILDYMAWVLYESAGSPRLNKVTRQILSRYCPFPKEYREKLKSSAIPEEEKGKLEKEIDHLASMPPMMAETAVARNYLDWVFDLPWGKESEDILDLSHAKEILDEDHYGLTKIKERILEYLAVRVLAPDAKAPIICFVGPPGVGKTSLAQSIARSMGRKFARIALGGVHDEAEIRGHRRTYIAAMPGRFIEAINQAQTKNPLILLDEIDKVSSDLRCRPSGLGWSSLSCAGNSPAAPCPSAF